MFMNFKVLLVGDVAKLKKGKKMSFGELEDFISESQKNLKQIQKQLSKRM